MKRNSSSSPVERETNEEMKMYHKLELPNLFTNYANKEHRKFKFHRKSYKKNTHKLNLAMKPGGCPDFT